jgi:glycosyltransferase involved in cell wall biosynthesis
MRKNMIKFSVLITSYANENFKYFKESMESLINQSLLPNQIVLVKDGDLTFNHDEYLEEFKKRFENIKIVGYKNNRGQVYALNYGIKYCDYDYIARMDTDDICLRERFKEQANILDKDKTIDICGTLIEEYDEKMTKSIGIRKVPKTSFKIKKYGKYRCPVNHMSVIIKKKVLKNEGGYPENFGTLSDYALWSKLINKGYIFYNLQKILIKARTGGRFKYQRAGKEYWNNEKKLIKYQKEINYINFIEYFTSFCLKKIVRILIKYIGANIYILFRVNKSKYNI